MPPFFVQLRFPMEDRWVTVADVAIRVLVASAYAGAAFRYARSDDGYHADAVRIVTEQQLEVLVAPPGPARGAGGDGRSRRSAGADSVRCAAGLGERSAEDAVAGAELASPGVTPSPAQNTTPPPSPVVAPPEQLWTELRAHGRQADACRGAADQVAEREDVEATVGVARDGGPA